MTGSGSLRHQARLTRPSTARNEVGERAPGWEVVCDVRCEIAGLSGTHYFAAMAQQSGVTARARIRHRSGVMQGWRLVQGDVTWRIDAVIPDARRQWMTLMLEVDDGNG